MSQTFRGILVKRYRIGFSIFLARWDKDGAAAQVMLNISSLLYRTAPQFFPMLTQRRLPVSLSLISTDLPLLSTIETSGILSQKDQRQFHLLLNQLDAPQSVIDLDSTTDPRSRLLWLEISPSRAVMTIQGTGKFACRHFWEKGIYGRSRYWLNDQANSTFCLQNFTRNLQLSSDDLPRSLRVDYELWAGSLQLGHYVLHLEIHQ